MKLINCVETVSGLLGLIFLTSIAYAEAPKTPMILSVNPKVVDPGGELTISGEFVGADESIWKSTVLVEIDDKEEKNFFIVQSGNEIKVPSVFYPNTAPTGVEFPRKVVVSIDGKRSNAYPFLQFPNPFILSIVPEIIAPGDKVTLTGSFVVLEGEHKEEGVKVMIDNESVDFLSTKPGKEIVIPRFPEPKEKTGYKWQVVVLVNDKESNRYTFPQQKLPTPAIFSVTPMKIFQGDKITIKGNFQAIKKESRNGAVKVKIDGQPVDFVTKKPGEEIEVVVGDTPADLPENKDKPTQPSVGTAGLGDLSDEKKNGEYPRSVTVEVDGQQSNSVVITQLTWDSLLRPHVFFAMGIFILGVASVVIFRRGNPFKSETGQLSLSKIQMALWTLVFGFAYIVLSAIWWDFLDITEGMFVLMGISSVTAVGAKAIVIKNVKIPAEVQKISHDVWARGQEVDQFHGTEVSEKQKEYMKSVIIAGKEFQKLYPEPATAAAITEPAIKDLEDFLNEKPPLKVEELKKKTKGLISAVTKAVSPPSKLLHDWDKESERYSLSLHRCQIALWTLIVLGLYLVELIGTMHLPDIPEKLLVLMGISGGAYLGFNYPKIATK